MKQTEEVIHLLIYTIGVLFGCVLMYIILKKSK
jgi:hypothetical protein